MFKTLDQVLAKRTPEDRARIIEAGDKLAAKRDAAVLAATGEKKVEIPKQKMSAHA